MFGVWQAVIRQLRVPNPVPGPLTAFPRVKFRGGCGLRERQGRPLATGAVMRCNALSDDTRAPTEYIYSKTRNWNDSLIQIWPIQQPIVQWPPKASFTKGR